MITEVCGVGSDLFQLLLFPDFYTFDSNWTGVCQNSVWEIVGCGGCLSVDYAGESNERPRSETRGSFAERCRSHRSEHAMLSSASDPDTRIEGERKEGGLEEGLCCVNFGKCESHVGCREGSKEAPYYNCFPGLGPEIKLSDQCSRFQSLPFTQPASQPYFFLLRLHMQLPTLPHPMDHIPRGELLAKTEVYIT